MAGRRKNNKKPGKGYRIALRILAGALLVCAAFIGSMAWNANVVHVRRATVEIADLPPAFEGRTLLFASDIDLCGINTPKKAGALFDTLQRLNPDILVLGGDYSSESVFHALNRGDSAADSASGALRSRSDFFNYISSFSAPLGKFAIAAPEDADRASLEAQMSEAGIRPLLNARVDIALGGDTLSLVGICDGGAEMTRIGSEFRRSDCCVSIVWSPAGFPLLVTSEAGDGGAWADLLLSGHTHDGQIRLFGRSVLPLDAMESQYRSGWRVANGVPILVSSGIGCEGANLRLGTEPEVWLLTLTREFADE